MINFGSFAQRNTLNQLSNDPSLDHADQWSDESLPRVDLIDHWSENVFARKERHRSEIQIQILPKECTLNVNMDILFQFWERPPLRYWAKTTLIRKKRDFLNE